RGRERPFISFVKDNHRESEQETNENSMDMFHLEQVTNENDIDSVHLQELIDNATVSKSPKIDVEQLQHEIQMQKEFLDHLTAEFEQKNYQHVQALLNNTMILWVTSRKQEKNISELEHGKTLNHGQCF
ncbi:8052_t:CDS:1, partial [Paraglomus brasilianum]